MYIGPHSIKLFDDIAADARASRSVEVSREMILAFGALTGDRNPLHSDDEFGAATPFGQINMQGQFLSSLVVGIIGSDLPGPGWFCLGVNADFTEPVFVGDRLEVVLSVRQKMDALKIVVWDGKIARTSDGKVVTRAVVKTRCMF